MRTGRLIPSLTLSMEERETRERLARRSKTNIIGQLHRGHRSLAFRKFFNRIEAEMPAELDVHLILDNYGTPKTATIQRWLDSVARFCQRFRNRTLASFEIF